MEQTGHNPATGRELTIPAARTVKFTGGNRSRMRSINMRRRGRESCYCGFSHTIQACVASSLAVLPYLAAASPPRQYPVRDVDSFEFKGELVSWKKAQRAHARSDVERGHTFFLGLDDGWITDAARGGEFHRIRHIGEPNWRH
ncbi:hypothetical protein SB861_53915 [Paraburkholderia sp. SIMBA_049]